MGNGPSSGTPLVNANHIDAGVREQYLPRRQHLRRPIGVDGYDHDDYDGAHRVISAIKFRWDGSSMSNVQQPAGALFGETVLYRQYWQGAGLTRDRACAWSGPKSLT